MTSTPPEIAPHHAGRGRHILILIENLTLPIDRRVMLEARSYLRAGYKVSCITPRMYGHTKRHEVVEGIHVWRYSFIEAQGGAIAYAWEFGWCLLMSWLLSLWIALRRGRIHLIHACNPPDTFWLMGLFWRPFGTRFLFDEHDVCPAVYEAKFREGDGAGKPNPRLLAILAWLERMSLRTADAVINVCDAYREDSALKGATPLAKLFVVRSAPDLARFRRVEPDASLRKDHQHVAVYVGVMGPQDGLDLLVRAIGEYVNTLRRTDTLFVLIGDGPSRQEAQGIAKKLGVERHVFFPGYTSGDKLLGYLSAADLGLLPDPKTPFNDKTAMNKAYEYPALSLPFVGFDLLENRRVAGDDAALWVPAHDLLAFANAVAQLCDNPAERKRRGEAGRERIVAHHTWNHAERHLFAAAAYALDGVPPPARTRLLHPTA